MNGKPDPADLVLLGVVIGVRGLNGDLRIKSFTADPEDLAAYGPLWDEAGEVSYRLRVTGEVKGHLIARIKGVSNRTAAETVPSAATRQATAASTGRLRGCPFAHAWVRRISHQGRAGSSWGNAGRLPW